MSNIRGKFVCEEVRLWPVSFGMNTKGVIDDHEFELYLLNSIFSLLPDAKDQKRKRFFAEGGQWACKAQCSALV